MGDKSGHTKKTTDWLGREKEEHYDSSGNKIGETKFTTNWLGSPKQEHYDTEGTKTGETRKGSDWLGRDRAEHFNSEGKKAGYSKNDTDWLGRPVQRHYTSSGEQTGTSRRKEDWIGRSQKEHEGSFFKARGKDTDKANSQDYSSDNAYDDSRHSNSSAPGSYSEMPWQWIVAELSKVLGLRRLSKFFYSASANVYLTKGNNSLSARMEEKAGEFDTSLERFVIADEIFEARRIAKKNGLEVKLVGILQRYGKREEAAELACDLGMKKEALKIYETAGETGPAEKAVYLLEKAGIIAEEIEEIDEAIRLYKRAGGIGTSIYVKASTMTWFYAGHLLERAEKLEKSIPRGGMEEE